MTYSYILTPFIAWAIAGSVKFILNSLRAKKRAFALIGYGGMPSNHTAIVCSMVSLIACKQGLQSPSLGVAITVAFIVMLDASSLRRQIGMQAVAINSLNQTQTAIKLRERIGHSLTEILAGASLGAVLGWLIANSNI